MEQGLSSSPPAPRMFSLEVRVAGRVQGVGFRYFAHERARRLGLTGYVRNLRDGSVRAYAEGPKEALEKFLRLMHEGPQGGLVRDLRATWGSASGQYTAFSIERTL